MRNKVSITALMFGAAFLAGCATNSVEVTKKGDLSIKVESDAKTEIDMVKIWQKDGGDFILTGRIMQRGYGRLIKGHVDVEFVRKGEQAPRQFVGEIDRAFPITKQLKRANFDSNLGELDLVTGQLNLRYHEEAHLAEPLELKKTS